MTKKEKNLQLLLHQFLHRNPAIAAASANGLVNRRSLARFVMKEEALSPSLLGALLSAIRRLDLPAAKTAPKPDFSRITVQTKDSISLLTLERTEATTGKIKSVLDTLSRRSDETLKIVVGSQSVKLFVDDSNQKTAAAIFTKKELRSVRKSLSEINMLFSEEASKTPGIIAYITAELTTAGINMVECLSCTPELLLYVTQQDLLQALDVISRIKHSPH